MNGLCSKIHLLQEFLVKPFQTDVLLITESHLTPLISNATVAIPGFVLLRNDSGDSSKHGVCLYVREGIKYDNVDASHANCPSLRLSKLDLYVYVVYRPPSNSSDQNQALTNFLLHNCADKEVVLLGDFNLPSITWNSNEPCGGSPSLADVKFLDVFNTLGLTQWVSESTFPRSGNVLDLVLTTEQDRVGRVVDPPPPGCDHCSVHCEYLFDAEVQSPMQGQARLLWHHGQY